MGRRLRMLVAATVGAAALLVVTGQANPVLATAGDPVGTFGTDGVRREPSIGTFAGMAVQPDGKIVVARNTAGGHVVVSRLKASGAVDSSFAGDGTLELSPERDQMQGIALALDGTRIVLLAQDRAFGIDLQTAVVRITGAGALDRSFGGGDGRVLFAGSVADREAQALDVMDDHRIVVLVNDAEGATAPFVHRLLPSGAPDTDFGGDGEARVPVGSKAAAGAAIDVNDAGGIVVVAQRGDASLVVSVIARMKASGGPVKSFGTNGSVVVRKGTSAVTQAWDGEFTADGGVVAGGYTSVSAATKPQFLGFRLTPTGAMDTSFSSDGFQSVAFGADAAYAFAIAQQGNGKLLVVGTLQNAEVWAVARLKLDGSLDTTFAIDGRAAIDLADGTNPFARAAQISPNGQRLYVGGTVSTDSYHVTLAALRLT